VNLVAAWRPWISSKQGALMMCFWPPISWFDLVLQKEPPGYFYTKLLLQRSSKGTVIHQAMDSTYIILSLSGAST
jgi:hypothetical protein